MNPKRPATAAARRVRKGLEALAERGINGERDVARVKLAALIDRYDFGQQEVSSLDLFKGKFERGPFGVPVGIVPEMDIASAVKWAIETRTGIACRFQGDTLLAEASPGTAKTLEGIVAVVGPAFVRLWQTYEQAGGLRADRNCFLLGLFEGMMNDERKPGQPLPARGLAPRRKSKGKQAAIAPGLSVHPYSLAVGYGRKIRFSVPVAEVEKELRDRLQPQIEETTPSK